MASIRIKNGRVIDPASGTDKVQDVCITKGKIVSLGEPPKDFQADTTLDAANRVVCPGLVDLSVHLREPGLEHKATIKSEMRAAARGGITTLCCEPNTQPVIDTPAVVELIQERAKEAGLARIVMLGALTSGLKCEQLSEMAALKKAGCVGVSNGWYPIRDTRLLRQCLQYAATYDLTLFFHPEDADLTRSGCAHEGVVSSRMGLPGIPTIAETIAVSQMLELAEDLQVRVHFCRLSSAKSVHMIERAKAEGLPVTADVAVHQLHLTEVDLDGFDSLYHVRPPLRTVRDRQALRQGVAERGIDAVCSDHQPHDIPAKFAPFQASEPGISGLETLLPLTLHLVQQGEMTLMDALATVTSIPAAIINREVGRLVVGGLADICIFDPEATWSLVTDGFVSKGHNSPFESWTLQGQVKTTILGGKIVYQSKN